MSVHFLHTSDWHLGQFFHGHQRDYEHQQFLAWLLDQIEQLQPDALLIAGDIFDVINPASSAQKKLYQFLADAHQRAPKMQTLMIAGNHDSGYRIEQVAPLLHKYHATAVGVIQRKSADQLNIEHLMQPIYNSEQQIVAWCLTLPYLRSAEITGLNEQTREHSSAMSYVHQQLIAQAKARKSPEQALILMSHAHVQGGQSSDSERPIIIGNEEALSTDLFDEVIDYVALGHLHKPQQVAAAHIRYSGSPIPLSFSEINYRHQVLQIRIDPSQSPEHKLQIQSLLIPRAVQLLRLRGSIEEILEQIKDLQHGEIAQLDQRDFVEIEYHTQTPPPPNLRQIFEQALPADRYRLVRVARKYLAQVDENNTPKIALEPPTPERLFQSLWQKQGFDADPQVLKDFASLVSDAQHTLEDHAP